MLTNLIYVHDNLNLKFLNLELDKDLWNEFLLNLDEGQSTFFGSCFLYAECYVFRRLVCYLENTETLKTFDYYANKKQKSLIAFLGTIEIILFGIRTVGTSDDVLRFLLRVCIIFKYNIQARTCQLYKAPIIYIVLFDDLTIVLFFARSVRRNPSKINNERPQFDV